MAAEPFDLFGGLFDLDGDGRTDIAEEFLAYKMFEAVTGEGREDEEGQENEADEN